MYVLHFLPIKNIYQHTTQFFGWESLLVPSLMELSIPIRRKPALSIEFPTSPQPYLGEEIRHSSHPHPLTLFTLSERFTCAGCKEYGAGKRFTCQQCDFQLHDFCASSPPLINAHPLHSHAQHQLVFYSKLKPGGLLWARCDICGKASKGYAFRCSACSFQMHPSCAMLSTEMNMSSHPHLLRLLPLPTMSLSNNVDDIPGGFACGECKRKRLGRVYRCTVCDQYHIHAACAKDMINGLQPKGMKSAPEKPTSNMLGAASRVVIGFLGRLIEGLGEGVGEGVVQILTQDTPKGLGGCNANIKR